MHSRARGRRGQEDPLGRKPLRKPHSGAATHCNASSRAVPEMKLVNIPPPLIHPRRSFRSLSLKNFLPLLLPLLSQNIFSFFFFDLAIYIG